MKEFPSEKNLLDFDSDDDQQNSKVENKIIPFIAYTSGSYFGDVDLFRVNRIGQNSMLALVAERDSTAIAETDSSIFELSKEPLIKMSEVFKNEFAELEKLAKARKLRHNFLQQKLITRVKQIMEEKKDLIGGPNEPDFIEELEKQEAILLKANKDDMNDDLQNSFSIDRHFTVSQSIDQKSVEQRRSLQGGSIMEMQSFQDLNKLSFDNECTTFVNEFSKNMANIQ